MWEVLWGWWWGRSGMFGEVDVDGWMDGKGETWAGVWREGFYISACMREEKEVRCLGLTRGLS